MNIDLGYMKPVVVFDLDDTLFPETDYLFSGYNAIAKFLYNKYRYPHEECFNLLKRTYYTGGNAFDTLLADLTNFSSDISESISTFLDIYRHHFPNISLPLDSIATLDFLQSIGITMGLITDGRSITQRNKIKALSIEKYFNPDNILISEEQECDKQSPDSFIHFVHRYPNANKFIYVGDNPQKDFLYPNLLGWQSICIEDTGNNIHKQTSIPSPDHAPQFTIKSIKNIITLL